MLKVLGTAMVVIGPILGVVAGRLYDIGGSLGAETPLTVSVCVFAAGMTAALGGGFILFLAGKERQVD